MYDLMYTLHIIRNFVFKLHSNQIDPLFTAFRQLWTPTQYSLLFPVVSLVAKCEAGISFLNYSQIDRELNIFHIFLTIKTYMYLINMCFYSGHDLTVDYFCILLNIFIFFYRNQYTGSIPFVHVNRFGKMRRWLLVFVLSVNFAKKTRLF